MPRALTPLALALAVTLAAAAAACRSEAETIMPEPVSSARADGAVKATDVPPRAVEAVDGGEAVVNEGHLGDVRRPLEGAPLEIAAAAEPGRVCGDDSRIRACRVIRGREAHQISLAAEGGVVAVAVTTAGNVWVTAGGEPGAAARRVEVLLHDHQLRSTGAASISFPSVVSGVAVTPAFGGWLLAASGDFGLELVSLNRAGRERGKRTVIAEGASPHLVADSEAPLLSWITRSGAVVAGAVEVGGALRWQTTLFESSVEAQFGSEVAVGRGAFMVARRVGSAVSVVKVDRDGARQQIHADVGSTSEYPSLARCAGGVRMIWSEFGVSPAEVRWAPLDRDGAVIGGPSRLSGIPDHFNFTPAICEGDDTLALLTGHTGSTGVSKSLDLVRVSPRGAVASGALRVSAASIFDPEMVRDGDDVFVAWVVLGEHPRLVLARVDAAAVGRGPARALEGSPTLAVPKDR